MTDVSIKKLCEHLDAHVHVDGAPEHTVNRVAVGDLLSFVMGSNAEGTAWITIQTHLNVAAVAVLKEMPIIIIASGRTPADDLIERCRTEEIALITVRESIFDTCVKLGQLGLVG